MIGGRDEGLERAWGETEGRGGEGEGGSPEVHRGSEVAQEGHRDHAIGPGRQSPERRNQKDSFNCMKEGRKSLKTKKSGSQYKRVVGKICNKVTKRGGG